MTRDWLVRRVRGQARAQRPLLVAVGCAFAALAVLVGASVLGTRVARRWIEAVGQDVHAIAFLRDDLEAGRARELGELLRQVPGVAAVETVEPAQALAKLRAAARPLAGIGVVLEGVEPGYLPRSLEIRLAPGDDLPARAGELARRLRTLPGVADVDAMTEGLAQMANWIRLGKRLGWAAVLASVLCAVALLALALARDREPRLRQARVLTLLGETPAGIRLPASLGVAAASTTGAAIGLALLGLAWGPLVRGLEAGLGLGSIPSLAFLAPGEIAFGLTIALLAGGALGYTSTPVPDVDEAVVA
jgi:cell division transport system permease protein